jgi:hypothetical protein
VNDIWRVFGPLSSRSGKACRNDPIRNGARINGKLSHTACLAFVPILALMAGAVIAC